ncbi:MAG: hypothetical protein RBT74_07710 [Tenuifilaceae bacterium]|nr:hypothetical protein [Tenuifilaceae bacterium]
MKRLSFCAIFLLAALAAVGQINIADSTMQVVGYWDMNESLTYVVYNQSVRTQGADTLLNEYTRYEVDVTIVDSTENSYTIKWHYRDYFIETDNEVMKRLSSIFEDMSVLIKTDELGSFLEIINWEEIKTFMLITTALMREEFKEIPNMDQFIAHYEALYSTKEAIQNSAIDEIHQYYYFHGLNYKLHEEYNSQSTIQNRFGGEPFNADITFWLDDINPDDNNAIFRMTQVVDSDELTNATFEYLTSMANMLGTPPSSRDDFPALTNEITRASRIHGSGWVIYSIDTKEVKAENVLQVDTRIVELK